MIYILHEEISTYIKVNSIVDIVYLSKFNNKYFQK